MTRKPATISGGNIRKKNMEFLKMSKFKLQLQTLVTEVRFLREKERSATEQCQILIQRQKQVEEEHTRKLQELQAELASSNELRQKLERKVAYLQNDNLLLENRQKDLKGTIQSLVQSKESFINAYEESICEMRRSIEARDRKLSVLSDKINSHLLLFDSIEKEAFSIKQVVYSVQSIVSEKEEVVACLRTKMDEVSSFENKFVAKINDLENKLRSNENEIRRKDRIISEVEAQLEAAKVGDNHKYHIEELQRTLTAKDEVIQNLISQNEALHCEVRSLSIVLQKIGETVAEMNEKDKKAFYSVLEHQKDIMVKKNEDDRIDDSVQIIQVMAPNKAASMGNTEIQVAASPTYHEEDSVGKPLQENKQIDTFMLESPCSELQSAANVSNISVNTGKVNSTEALQCFDSECSTTQAENSQHQIPD